MSPWSSRPVASPVFARVLVGGLLAAAAGCSEDVALTDARPQLDAAVPGQIALSWTIGHDGSALSCADIAASTVTVDIVHDGDAFGVVDTFDCAAGTGTTRMLEPGLYQLRVSVSGAGGTLDGPEAVRDLVVPPGGVRTAPPVAFDVDPTGGMKFRITTPTNGNCAPAAGGGAGITAQRIELRDAAGGCIPAQFTITAGASQPAATYASDCLGSTHGCIASDQEVSLTGLRAGSYSMVMTGSVDGAACWRRQPNAIVPAAGRSAELPPQQLALATGVPGCPTM